jgi:flavin-binding protein dodecin
MAKEPASGVVGNRRQVVHHFLILIEELVMAVEGAEDVVDNAVAKLDDQVTRIMWQRVKDKLRKLEEADDG